MTAQPSSGWEEGLLEKGLQCPICIEFLCAPLKLGCGHTFCRLCLLQSTRLAPDGRRCPECRTAIEIRDPIGHPVDEAVDSQIRTLVPPALLAARKESDAQLLESLVAQDKQNLPIFYMHGVASKPGQRVQLHFFEPRYKVLIRRAWEGNHRFVCTQSSPCEGDVGLIVQVELATFLPDGRANIRGHGVELTKLKRVWVERHTGGLFYAEVAEMQKSLRASASRVDRLESRSQRSASSRPQLENSEQREAHARDRMRNAISQGAPEYNNGRVQTCVEIYTEATRQILQDLDTESHMALRLRLGLQLARRASHGDDADAAAWALRHAFDEVLLRESPSRPPAMQPMLLQDTELPIFYMSNNIQVDEPVHLNFFEPRYRVLAQEVWDSNDKLFLYARTVPSVGAAAILVSVEQCRRDDNGHSHVEGCAIAKVRLGRVRQDAAKGGLYFACCSYGESRGLTASSSRADDANTVDVKCCCVVQ